MQSSKTVLGIYTRVSRTTNVVNIAGTSRYFFLLFLFVIFNIFIFGKSAPYA